jgi:curli production assembly/transport component CsgE
MKRFCLALILVLSSCVASAGEEDEMLGFIVDDTISHIGHDFYYAFSERLRATSRWISTWWYANAHRLAGAAW